jgi:Predicted nucleic acid-binding protein, contains PIN domain
VARRTRRPVTRVSAFWDTSALVPLCAGQQITPQAERLYRQFDVVIWWATPLEIASALARLLRTKHIHSAEFSESHKIAKQISESSFVIQPSDSLLARAMRLVEHHDLAAADALQLSAALEWCGDRPHGRVFLTADRRLREAATLNGFDTNRL